MVQESEFIRPGLPEFLIAPRMSHPSVVEVLLHWVDGKTHWQIMEYYPESLWNRISANSSMPREEAACLFRQLLAGASYLHSERVAHNDLKTSNVMIDRNGGVRTIDLRQAYYFHETNGKGREFWEAARILNSCEMFWMNQTLGRMTLTSSSNAKWCNWLLLSRETHPRILRS